MTILHSPSSVYERYSRFYNRVMNWLQPEPDSLAYIDLDVSGQAKQLTEQVAVHDQAAARIDILLPHSQQRWSKKTQQTVELTITLIGAFTFSTIPQILGAASNRGPLATLAGLVGGAAVAWFTHDRANKALGDLRCAHSSRSALKILEQRQYSATPQNMLTEAYFNRRKDLLWQVEAESLSPSFPYDLWGALVATILETAAAFWLTLPAGVMVAFLAAGFPAAVIWLSSVFQSQRVDFAEWALIKFRTYQQYLPPEDRTHDGRPYIVVTDPELLAVTSVNAHFNYFIAVNTNGIKTPQGAEAKARSSLAESEMSDWAEAYHTAEQALLQTQQQALQSMAHEYQVSPSQKAGRRAEEIRADQGRTIAAERERLQEQHQVEQGQLKQTYSTVIKRWDGVRLQAQEEFDRWEGNDRSDRVA